MLSQTSKVTSYVTPIPKPLLSSQTYYIVERERIMEHTLTLHGDLDTIKYSASAFSNAIESLVQIANPHVNVLGLHSVYRGTGYLLQKNLYSDDGSGIAECSCSLPDDEPENFYDEPYNHDESCPVVSVYNVVSDFSHNDTPVTIEFRKQGDSLEVTFSDQYRDLDESRMLYENQSDVNDIVKDEVWRGLSALGNQFPIQDTLRRRWLWTGGTVSVSIDPNIRYQDESHQNRIHISISNELPRKPFWVKVNDAFSVLQNNPKPFTFDLREFTLGSFDEYGSEAVEKCGYSDEIM